MLSWFLYLIPNSLLTWIFYSLFSAGVFLILASWFITIIPVISRYRFPTQVIGIIAFGLGAFLIGGIEVEKTWRARVAELEAKLQVAEQQSQNANETIQKVYIDKIRTVRDTQVVVQERIKEVERVVNADCRVAPEALEILNRATDSPVAKEINKK